MSVPAGKVFPFVLIVRARTLNPKAGVSLLSDSGNSSSDIGMKSFPSIFSGIPLFFSSSINLSVNLSPFSTIPLYVIEAFWYLRTSGFSSLRISILPSFGLKIISSFSYISSRSSRSNPIALRKIHAFILFFFCNLT